MPAFRERVDLLLAGLKAEGITMVPFVAIRDPFEQARLWRQSRSREEIVMRVRDLKLAGAIRIAKCIESVGPQHGKPVTNAPPGLSWHQHGEAVDCYLLDYGQRADWNADAKGYVRYAEMAVELGLTAGRKFRSSDPVHVQLRKDEPQHLYEISRIDHQLAARFPDFAAL